MSLWPVLMFACQSFSRTKVIRKTLATKSNIDTFSGAWSNPCSSWTRGCIRCQIPVRCLIWTSRRMRSGRGLSRLIRRLTFLTSWIRKIMKVIWFLHQDWLHRSQIKNHPTTTIYPQNRNQRPYSTALWSRRRVYMRTICKGWRIVARW